MDHNRRAQLLNIKSPKKWSGQNRTSQTGSYAYARVSWWLILEQQSILATTCKLVSSSILIHSTTNEICVQRIGGRLMQPTPQVGMHLSSVVQWPSITESDTVARRPAIIKEYSCLIEYVLY